MNRDTNNLLIARIARLERKVLALSAAASFLGAGFLGTLLLGASSQSPTHLKCDTIEARQFNLLGPGGKAAMLGFQDAGPEFRWPGLFLYDDHGRNVVRLYVRGEKAGAFGDPELEFSNSSGKTTVQLYSRDAEATGLSFYDGGSMGAWFRLVSGSGAVAARQDDGKWARWPDE